MLAGELLDAQEALASERTASAAGHTAETWDETSAAADGDFFSQERMMIAEQRSSGRISAPDALALREMLRRIQDVSAGDTATPWHPGHFAKRFPSSAFAPALARAALTATAAEIPSDTFAAAALLTSELVTNSVTHAGSAWIDVAITLRRDRVRVEVSDQSVQAIRPRLGATDAGWGLALIGELATRWGTDRTDTGKTIWFELALSP